MLVLPVLLLASCVVGASMVNSSSITEPAWECSGTTAAVLRCRCYNDRILDEATWLLQLDCAHLNITSLPEPFKMPLFAKRLDLSSNNITSLKAYQFSQSNSLEELILVRNSIISIHATALRNITNLLVFDLSHNLVTSLPAEMFFNLPKVQVINLSHNKLKMLDINLFIHVHTLDELDLSYNPLGEFLTNSPDSVTPVFKRGLRSLNINNISLLEAAINIFKDADNLKALHLANNPLSSVPSLYGMLEYLDLSGVDITVILPGSFLALPQLRTLMLNRLDRLNEIQQNAFEGLASLETLSLENCVNLRAIHDFAFGSEAKHRPPLRKLSLAWSGLRHLSVNVVNPLDKLRHLNIEGNPWHCNCRLQWLRLTALADESKSHTRCFSPAEHHNQLLMRLSPEEFVCKTRVVTSASSKQIVIVNFVLSLVMFIAVMLVLVVMYRRGMLPLKPRSMRQADHIVYYQPCKSTTTTEAEVDDAACALDSSQPIPSTSNT